MEARIPTLPMTTIQSVVPAQIAISVSFSSAVAHFTVGPKRELSSFICSRLTVTCVL